MALEGLMVLLGMYGRCLGIKGQIGEEVGIQKMVVLLAPGFISGREQSCCRCRDQVGMCSTGVTGPAVKRLFVVTVCFPEFSKLECLLTGLRDGNVWCCIVCEDSFCHLI